MGHSKTITASDISHNGKYIATGSIDRSIIIWEKKSGKQIRILHHHMKSITALQFSQDDKLILSASNDNTVKLTNIERSEEHTSELQSRAHLVCRLLLVKKKKN